MKADFDDVVCPWCGFKRPIPSQFYTMCINEQHAFEMRSECIKCNQEIWFRMRREAVVLYIAQGDPP